MSALTFKFDDSPVNVIDRNGSLWFVAADVVRALHLSNTSVSLKALRPFDKDKIEINGKETNIISEGGMYFLTLRSQDALKEGTPAYRFSIWVTNEVLPTIRKQGRYECPIATITPDEQLAIQLAVSHRAQKTSKHFQTIYRAIKVRYQIAKYDQLPRAQFEDCLRFIESVELSVPAKPAAPELPDDKILVSRDFLERLRVFVYYWRYLFRDDLERVHGLMESLHSPLAPHFWEAVHNLNLSLVECDLEKLGYPVKELKCYKYWLAHQGS